MKRIILHGRSKTVEHNLWLNMRQRCYDKNYSGYYKYGGHGIKICKRWLKSFLNFFNDMGERPSKKYSIERIDNNADYKPSNCKWGTATEQSRNQRLRKDNISGKRGVSWYLPKSKWVVHIGLNYKQIYIGYFDNLRDAIAAREKAEHDYWGI